MQVAKWGNSLAVRLPKSLVEELKLKAGDDISVLAASSSKLEIEKLDRRRVAVAELDSFKFKVPEDYRFNRDEANAR